VILLTGCTGDALRRRADPVVRRTARRRHRHGDDHRNRLSPVGGALTLGHTYQASCSTTSQFRDPSPGTPSRTDLRSQGERQPNSADGIVCHTGLDEPVHEPQGDASLTCRWTAPSCSSRALVAAVCVLIASWFAPFCAFRLRSLV